MSNSANMQGIDGLGFHRENSVATSEAGIPPLNPGVAPAQNPVDVGSHISQHINLQTGIEGNIRRGDQPNTQR